MRSAWMMVLMFAAAGLASAQSPFSFSNKPGQYGVGLRLVRQYDASRSFKPALPANGAAENTRGRPIQTVVWYPARQGGKGVSYADYLNLTGWEIDFTLTPEGEAKVTAEWIKFADAIPAAHMAAVRSQSMWAVRDAAPVTGKFPVVVYAPSLNGTAFENADLAEYLASHGYIVIASPSFGKDSRELQADLEHAELQAADIRFLIDYAATLPQADMTQVTAMGFSWGGLANVLAAAKDERIKSLVCLDGSVRYYNKLLADAGYVKPENFKTPLLYMARRPHDQETLIQAKPDLSGSFLNRMTGADNYMVTMMPMQHIAYASSFIRLDPIDHIEYSPEEVSATYSLGARYVLNFLNAYAKNNNEGKAFLTAPPVKHGAQAHMVNVKFKPAAR
jgi:dienelactone hydrolase